MAGSYAGGFHEFGSGNLSLGFQQHDRLKKESARRIVNASEGGKKKVVSTDGTREYNVVVVGGAPKTKTMVPVGTRGPGAQVVTTGNPGAVTSGPGLGVVTNGQPFQPVFGAQGYGTGAFFDGHGYAVPGGYYDKTGEFAENEIKYKEAELKPFRMFGIDFVPDEGWSQGQDFEDIMGESPLQWPYAAMYGINMGVNTALHYAGMGGNKGLQKSARDEVAFAKQHVTAWTRELVNNAWKPGARDYTRKSPY